MSSKYWRNVAIAAAVELSYCVYAIANCHDVYLQFLLVLLILLIIIIIIIIIVGYDGVCMCLISSSYLRTYTSFFGMRA